MRSTRSNFHWLRWPFAEEVCVLLLVYIPMLNIEFESVSIVRSRNIELNLTCAVICSKRLLGRFFSRKRKQPSADPTSNIVEENTCLNTNRHTATRDDRSVYERMRQRTCFRTQKTVTNNELNGVPCHHEQLVYTHVPNTRVKSRFYREHVRNMVKDGQQVAVPGSHSVPWSAEDDWSIPCTTACQLHEGSSSSHDTDHDHDHDDDDDASSVESLGCLVDMSEQGVERRRADVPRLDLTKALEIQRMDLMQTEDCE